jgi:hypothetical protein
MKDNMSLMKDNMSSKDPTEAFETKERENQSDDSLRYLLYDEILL